MILVTLTMTLFSEKILLFNRCIIGLMPSLIKKSWKVSIEYLADETTLESKMNIGVVLAKIFFIFYPPFENSTTRTAITGQVHNVSPYDPY